MSKKRTVQLLLIDGTATGRIQAKLDNWTGVAYKIPKILLPESGDRKDLKFRLAAVQIRKFCLCCLIGLGFLPDNLFSGGFNGAVRVAALPIRVSAGAVHGT